MSKKDNASINNVAPRVAAFIISSMITTVIVLSTWNCGLGFERRIQILAIVASSFWFLLLVRSKGWKEYNVTHLLIILAVVGGGQRFCLCGDLALRKLKYSPSYQY